MKKFVLSLALLLVYVCAFAQPFSTTETVYMSTPSDVSNIKLVIKYNYVPDEDGYPLKTGQLTMSGKNECWPDGYTVRSSYSLTAYYKNGNLNGAVRGTGTETFIKRGRVESTEQWSISGTFLNGLPNGLFTAGINGSRMTVNYKNGVLVGAYKKGDTYGSFTSSGVLAGTWHKGDVTYTFQNGVLISKMEDGRATPSAITSVARQYASGALSEDALRAKGYEIVQREWNFDEYSNMLGTAGYLCMYQFGLPHIGGYEFPDNIKPYKEIVASDIE